MDAKEVGLRLYNLRISRNETQDEVAEGANIGQSTLVRYESGQRLPTLKNIQKLAAHFGVGIEEITGDSSDESEIDSELADLNLALSGAIHTLDKEEKQDVLNYVRFKQSQKRK